MELDVTPERAEGMVDFWIRKGQIRKLDKTTGCANCSLKGSCPQIYDLPKVYEMVGTDETEDDVEQLILCP